jgi:D-xylonolactonase
MNFNELKFQVFTNANFTVAENPIWNENDQMLYWKGWQAGKIYRKAIENVPTEVETFDLPIGLIGGFVFTDKDNLLIFAQHGRVWHWQPGDQPVQIAELPGADNKTYFNDLIADPEGRVFVGVLGWDFFNQIENPQASWQPGSLWRFDPDHSFHCLESKVGHCPNGMAFSRDLNFFYFSVTDENTIYRYAYNRTTGKISQRTSFISSPICDGITIDAENGLWIAQAGGHPLVRYSVSGELLGKYYLPARGITSLTFGGPEYKTIFVTASDYPLGSDSRPGAGGVFFATQEIEGVPEFRVVD